MNDQGVSNPLAKVVAAWLGVWLSRLGIHTWSDAAAVVATIYTLLLIADWCWKKWGRK
jgi:hypothetical protein